MPTNTLAHLFAARLRTMSNANMTIDVVERNKEEIERLCKEFMPSGSGFDSGTNLDLDASSPSKLVFGTSFHHMNDGGFYDGWTHHVIHVTACHDGFDIRVTGRDRNGIKDYIAESFDHALRQSIMTEWIAHDRRFVFVLQR